MRIIYFYHYEDDLQGGVNKKIIAQISKLNELGVQINAIMIRSGNSDYRLPNNCTAITVDQLSSGDFLGRLKRARKYSKILNEIISSLGPYDILYYRSPTPVLFFYPLNYLKLFRKCILITEHQTIESKEYKLNRNYLSVLFDVFFGKFIRMQSDAIVGVTAEITDYEVNRSGNKNKPHITIGNGFDVNSVPLKRQQVFNDLELNLLFVANVSRWHGIDRLLKGLSAYSGTTKVILHIVGEGSELPHLQELTEELGIGDRVIFHGFLKGNSLDNLFDQCNIGVGSLGIHRIGLKEASILKAREYCARGIPFIYGIFDPDFPENFPYVLHMISDESPIDIEEVIMFAKRVGNDPNLSYKMNCYASENLDWSVKIKKLYEFLTMLTGDMRD